MAVAVSAKANAGAAAKARRKTGRTIARMRFFTARLRFQVDERSVDRCLCGDVGQAGEPAGRVFRLFDVVQSRVCRTSACKVTELWFAAVFLTRLR